MNQTTEHLIETIGEGMGRIAHRLAVPVSLLALAYFMGHVLLAVCLAITPDTVTRLWTWLFSTPPGQWILHPAATWWAYGLMAACLLALIMAKGE